MANAEECLATATRAEVSRPIAPTSLIQAAFNAAVARAVRPVRLA